MSRRLWRSLGGLALCVGAWACTPREAAQRDGPAQPAPVRAPEHSSPSGDRVSAARGAAQPVRSRAMTFRLMNAPAGREPSRGSIEGVGRRISGGSADAPPVLVDLADGTRLTLAPQTELWVFAQAPSLLLVRGELRVTRMPDAPRAGSRPARIATLAGSVEVSASADFWLRADVRPARSVGKSAASPRRESHPANLPAELSYRVQLALLRGALRWSQPNGQRGPLQTLLTPGPTLPKRLAAVQLLWLRDPVAAESQRDKAFERLAPARTAVDLDAALEGALSEQQALRARGQALLAPLKAAPAEAASLARDAGVRAASVLRGSVRSYQRMLVEHARHKQAQTAQLLMAAERSLLRVLGLCAAANSPACPGARAWSERFAARLSALLAS